MFRVCAKLDCWSDRRILSTFRLNVQSFSELKRFRSLKAFRNLTKTKFQPENEPGKIGFAPSEPAPATKLLKPTIFALTFSSATFVGASIWQYEGMRHNAMTIFGSSTSHIRKKLQESGAWIQSDRRLKYGSLRQQLNSWWNETSEGRKLFYQILFLNVLVFTGWRIKAFQAVMNKYFVASPTANAVCWPMVLSIFSHYSMTHLCLNMFVLNSFIDSIVPTLGKEQFLSFYLNAGVLSSLMSYYFKSAVGVLASSLGASGAIMGVIGWTCVKYPDTLLSIVFLPFIAFKANLAIKLIMSTDIAGLILGWKYFDHAAHLGGALFGIFWCYWGNTYIWKQRGPILDFWHKYRKQEKG